MKPLFIVIHHSKSPDHGFLNLPGIRYWHVVYNKWRDIGYQWIIEKVGKRYEILVGRMPTDIGAHCLSKNRKSWGICVIGDFDKKVPSQAQWNLTVKFVASLTELENIPIDNVLGHWEADPNTTKTCPGRCFDMDKFRKAVFDYKALHT